MGDWKPLVEFHWRGAKLIAKVDRDLRRDECVFSNDDITAGDRRAFTYAEACKLIDAEIVTVGMWATDRGEFTGTIVPCFGFMSFTEGKLMPHYRFIEPLPHNHRPSTMPHKWMWTLRDEDRVVGQMDAPTLDLAKTDFELYLKRWTL